MKLTYNGLTSSPKDDFDSWFEEGRGTGLDYEIEDDVDSTDEDDYGDGDTE